jgi:hypothetical protein
MATTVYNIGKIKFIDGTEVELPPLKIKYLRELMDAFELAKTSESNDDVITTLTRCAAIAMKQYYPEIKTVEDLEDRVDMMTVYDILNYSAGIKMNEDKEETLSEQAKDSGQTWDSLDLAKLESEVFLLGIWKDYEELELSLSMPELITTLGSKRELDYEEKKFLAGIQGIDLDKNSGRDSNNKWEEMKARVFSGGKAKDANDVLALQGVNAQKAGFGIGMGLAYEDLTKK